MDTLLFILAECALALAFVAALIENKKQSLQTTSTISEVSVTNDVAWFGLAMACAVSCIWLLSQACAGRSNVYSLVLAGAILAALITIRPVSTSRFLSVHAAFVVLGVIMMIIIFVRAQHYALAVLTGGLFVASIITKATKQWRATLLIEYPLLGLLLYGLFFAAPLA